MGRNFFFSQQNFCFLHLNLSLLKNFLTSLLRFPFRKAFKLLYISIVRFHVISITPHLPFFGVKEELSL